MPDTKRPAPKTPTTQMSRSRRWLSIAFIALLVILLAVFSVIQWQVNRQHAFQTSGVVVNQVAHIIENSKAKESTLVESLKEDYITRAKAASYLVDQDDEVASDVDELKKFAELISVDEIHLFDESGVIYGGTNPEYYGYSFDSGEQIAFFKPMLEDKSLSMCQDVTPNTAESKAMMYAICWNESGTRMTQVGIEPHRLIAELRANDISELVDSMPSYAGLDIYVADAKTDEILGSTHGRAEGKTLQQIGIDTSNLPDNSLHETVALVNGGDSYCTAKKDGRYTIAVAQRIGAANSGMPATILLLAAALGIAAIMFHFIVRRLTATIAAEQQNANTDPMTGLANRRAYEMAIASERDSSGDGTLVYVAMDLNGLKAANDALGHAAGDKLIKGAADCMVRSFGGYGSLYRIGGDEFVALIHADDAKLTGILRDFEGKQVEWATENGMTLSVSIGSVAIREHPDMTLAEIAETADGRMYRAKDAYYGDRPD